MEYEIVEPMNPGSWMEERKLGSTRPWRAIDSDDMCLKAMDIPESEEV